ncbi:MAG: hypothetical protein EA361_12585, partial [Bacteroidetes bacterium]
MDSGNTKTNKGATLPGYKSSKSFGVLLLGLALTAIFVYVTFNNLRDALRQEVQFQSIQLQLLFESRLQTQTQILRNGVGLFAASDTVTRSDWKLFYEHSRIRKHFPGIQGFGYVHFITPDLLSEHIESVRASGFPDYTVWPDHERDIYTSIVYLEPFSGRNLRAFGYDMYSESVRREAMQLAIDSNFSAISRQVVLVQETGEDIQPGFLIYAPVFRSGMPVNTVEERRAAVKGWVYSPYRVRDLTRGIFEQWQLTRQPGIHFQIYDGEVISEITLLYNSQNKNHWQRKGTVFTEVLPIRLNRIAWTLVTSSEPTRLLLKGNVLLVLFSGLTISVLLFFLVAELINARTRSQQINLLNKNLQKTNADKDRFISVLGHDLRNPFNGMLGLLDILIEDYEDMEDGQIREYLQFTKDVARNTYEMLDDLLEWGRFQTGRISFDPMPYQMNVICHEVIKQVAAQARTKNVTIHCKVNDDAMVFADHKMLLTIMRNLVTNAVKFSHPEGEVTIGAVSEPDTTTISVSDTGIGIEPDVKNKLFDITEVVTTKGTAGEKGSGLGLILCKEFIELHGGTIWVETEPGKGSSFCFTLPAE